MCSFLPSPRTGLDRKHDRPDGDPQVQPLRDGQPGLSERVARLFTILAIKTIQIDKITNNLLI
jgi:hypothetical protein